MTDNLPAEIPAAAVVEADEYVWRQHPVSGEWIPPRRQQMLLDWLTTPTQLREHPTKTQFCQSAGIPMNSVKVWQRDQRFQNALWKQARRVLVDPQTLIDIFHFTARSAMDEDMTPSMRYKYLRLYLELVGEIGQGGSGGNVWVNVFPTPVDQLSEAELEAQLAALERDRNTIDGDVVEEDGWR